MEYVISTILIIAIIASIATIIRYPTDVGKGILAYFLMPFERLWHLLSLVLLPLGLLIVLVGQKLKINYLTKLIDRVSPNSKKKISENKKINFQRFKKYIVVNSTSPQIEDELIDANECCNEVNIELLTISRRKLYSIIETPRNGFYGYNFLIQWLTNNLKENEIIGYASNGQTGFLTIVNTERDNDLVGITNRGKKFWVSLYDDLDNNQILHLNDELELNTSLSIDELKIMVQKD